MVRGRCIIYPWELWTDGEAHSITRGADFKVGVDGIRKQLLLHASTHNLAVVTWRRPEGGDTLWFLFFDPEGT